jgi:5-deoxy-glucuronate isomerase
MELSKCHIQSNDETNMFVRTSAGQSGLERMNMIGMSLDVGKKFTLTTNQYEYCAVILGGICDIRTNKGEFLDIGRRTDVFTGMPYAIYLPPNTDFEIESLSDDFQFASCWATARTEKPMRLIRPEDVKMRLNAVGRISTQINTITDGDKESFSVTETYLPSTNWGHFPPMRHSKTETVLLTKQDRLSGFALHRLYTEDTTNATFTSSHNDVVLIPQDTYHIMTSSPIGVTYVLAFGHSLGESKHPDKRYEWYRKVYENTPIDPRLPVVDIGMEPPDEDNA